MIPTPKFSIRRLEDNENACLATDICFCRNFAEMAWQHQPDGRRDPYYTYYRITLEPQPPAMGNETANETKMNLIELGNDWKRRDGSVAVNVRRNPGTAADELCSLIDDSGTTYYADGRWTRCEDKHYMDLIAPWTFLEK